ncbi:MAG: hypothetical protein ACYDDI_00555 [Candidatus Acidiferrales bacterium]
MQWTADGHSIYVYQFGTPASPRAKIFRLDLATGKRVLVKKLMPADRAGFGGFDLAAIIPDGKTIVYSYSRILTNLYLMQGAR